MLPNPAARFPLAAGPRPDRIGLRVPDVPALAGIKWPVLQSSANPAGGPMRARLEDVDPGIRASVDLQLDGGELPGTPSTVVDLGDYEAGGEYRVLREGAVPVWAVGALL